MSKAFQWEIPDYFYLMAQKVVVEWVDDLIYEQNQIGKTSNPRGVIKLQKPDKSEYITQDNTEIAFFHEFLHHVFQVTGLDERFDDEDDMETMIDLCARMMHQMVEDARVCDE